jgi:signal transduction histidine kinase
MPSTTPSRWQTAVDALRRVEAGRWEAGVRPADGRLCPPLPAALRECGGAELSWWRAIFPGDLPRVTSALDAARSGGDGAPLEYRLVLDPAGLVWVRHWITARPTAARNRLAPRWAGVVQVIDEQRRLAGECLRICECERQTLGQELHDDIGQVLAGAAALLQGMARRVRAVSRGVGGELDAVLRELHAGMARTRAIAHGLVVLKVAEGGVEDAMVALGAQSAARFGLKVSVRWRRGQADVRAAETVELFRIAQEAIRNAATHGGASRVWIRGTGRGTTARLTIRDNGSGIRCADLRREGLGLRLMAHRARALGGNITVARGATRGTVVTVDYPARRVPPAAGGMIS